MPMTSPMTRCARGLMSCRDIKISCARCLASDSSRKDRGTYTRLNCAAPQIQSVCHSRFLQDSDFAPNLSADDADEDNDEDSGGQDRPASEPDFDDDEVMCW